MKICILISLTLSEAESGMERDKVPDPQRSSLTSVLCSSKPLSLFPDYRIIPILKANSNISEMYNLEGENIIY